jgi:4-hydroxy-3-polyprenylbenzoate decarboxylase
LSKRKKILVALTGASGIELGVKFLDYLPKKVEKYAIVSKNVKLVKKLEKKKIKIFFENEIGAAVASGSFGIDIFAIIPCSMNTLAKISVGIADNLITRAASVALKEGKTLLLAPREMPFSQIALENMLRLSKMGVIIAPPVMGYYSNPKTLEEMEKFIIGKWFDRLGIENNLYKRWGESPQKI